MNTRQRKMVRRLQALRDGTTMCPGRLARDCGSTLREARPDLLALARAGAVKLSQRGKPVAPDDLKGAFRVRLREAGSASEGSPASARCRDKGA